MATTYTPPAGNSPQAQQMNNLQQTTANMSPVPQAPTPAPAQVANSMAAQYPAFVQGQAQSIGQNAQFPQAQAAGNDIEKQFALFQHDMTQAGSPIGTTAVPTQPPTPSPSVLGASTMTPATMGDPLAYGVQMGQSNPYYGTMFMDKALASGADASSSQLSNEAAFNLKEFVKQLGASKDVYQMAYGNQVDQAKLAEQQRQDAMQQQKDRVSMAASLVNLGIMTPEQASQALGLPTTPQAGSSDLADAIRSGDKTQIQKAYMARIAAAPTDALKTKMAQEYKDLMGEDLFQVTKAEQQQNLEAQNLQSAIDTYRSAIQKSQPGGLLGITALDVIPGLGGREKDQGMIAQKQILNNLVQNYYKTKAKTPIDLPDLSAGNEQILPVLDAIQSQLSQDVPLPTPGAGASANDPLGIL